MSHLPSTPVTGTPTPTIPIKDDLARDPFLDVRELLEALYRHKWGIVSITLVAVLLSGIWIFAVTPRYQATTTLLIESNSNRPVQQVPDIYNPGYGTPTYIGTQFQILQARDLAKDVVLKLKLTDKEEFQKPDSLFSFGNINWQAWLPFLPAHTTHDDSELTPEEQKVEYAVNVFQKHLTVEPQYGTDLVNVKYDSEDPKLAAQIANAMADAYIDSNLEARLDMTRKTTSWLNDRLGAIRSDLDKAETAMQAFRDKEHLVDVGGTRGLVESQLTDNLQRLRAAQQKKTDLASAYWKIKQAGNDYSQLESVSTLLANQVVQDAKTRLLEAQQKLKTLSSRYGPKHPLIQSAKASVDSATAAYHAQLMVAAQGVKAEYEVAAETERQISAQEQQARAQIEGLDRKQAQLDALQRDAATNQDLYNLFLTRFKETQTAGDYQDLVARVVDPAVVPDRPFEPKKKIILLWGTLAGFLLGIFAALLRHLLSDVISSSEELESLTGLQVLAALPEFKKGKDNSLQLLKEPKGGFSEGMRSVRTGLLLSDLLRKRKRIVVTSSIPQEGKTTIACNLAITLGQMEKVLLIDCDLRRPTAEKVLGLPSKTPGLTEVIAGTSTLASCIHHYEKGKIDILPVGQIPPNPGEILASEQFAQLIETLLASYDRIVFDSAPCQAVSDTLLLVQHADAVVFVVKADATTRNMIKGAVRQLRYAKAPLCGAVVNAVDMERNGKKYGGYYYGYRYYA